MAVSLVDVLVSGRPERSALPDAGPVATALAAVLVVCLVGRLAGRRR